MAAMLSESPQTTAHRWPTEAVDDSRALCSALCLAHRSFAIPGQPPKRRASIVLPAELAGWSLGILILLDIKMFIFIIILVIYLFSLRLPFRRGLKF